MTRLILLLYLQKKTFFITQQENLDSSKTFLQE
jgi:hypothetical protein